MTSVISCLFAYLGCGLLYQAKLKRSNLGDYFPSKLTENDWFTLLCRLLAVVLLGGSIYFATLSQGFERGFTIWLGIVSACGFLGLFVSAWNKSAHLPSLMVTFLLLVVSLLIYAL